MSSQQVQQLQQQNEPLVHTSGAYGEDELGCTLNDLAVGSRRIQAISDRDAQYPSLATILKNEVTLASVNDGDNQRLLKKPRLRTSALPSGSDSSVSASTNEVPAVSTVPTSSRYNVVPKVLDFVCSSNNPFAFNQVAPESKLRVSGVFPEIGRAFATQGGNVVAFWNYNAASLKSDRAATNGNAITSEAGGSVTEEDVVWVSRANSESDNDALANIALNDPEASDMEKHAVVFIALLRLPTSCKGGKNTFKMCWYLLLGSSVNFCLYRVVFTVPDPKSSWVPAESRPCVPSTRLALEKGEIVLRDDVIIPPGAHMRFVNTGLAFSASSVGTHFLHMHAPAPQMNVDADECNQRVFFGGADGEAYEICLKVHDILADPSVAEIQAGSAKPTSWLTNTSTSSRNELHHVRIVKRTDVKALMQAAMAPKTAEPSPTVFSLLMAAASAAVQGNQKPESEEADMITCVRFDPERKLLFTASLTGVLRCFDLNKPAVTMVSRKETSHPTAALCVGSVTDLAQLEDTALNRPRARSGDVEEPIFSIAGLSVVAKSAAFRESDPRFADVVLVATSVQGVRFFFSLVPTVSNESVTRSAVVGRSASSSVKMSLVHVRSPPFKTEENHDVTASFYSDGVFITSSFTDRPDGQIKHAVTVAMLDAAMCVSWLYHVEDVQRQNKRVAHRTPPFYESTCQMNNTQFSEVIVEVPRTRTTSTSSRNELARQLFRQPRQFMVVMSDMLVVMEERLPYMELGRILERLEPAHTQSGQHVVISLLRNEAYEELAAFVAQYSASETCAMAMYWAAVAASQSSRGPVSPASLMKPVVTLATRGGMTLVNVAELVLFETCDMMGPVPTAAHFTAANEGCYRYITRLLAPVWALDIDTLLFSKKSTYVASLQNVHDLLQCVFEYLKTSPQSSMFFRRLQMSSDAGFLSRQHDNHMIEMQHFFLLGRLVIQAAEIVSLLIYVAQHVCADQFDAFRQIVHATGVPTSTSSVLMSNDVTALNAIPNALRRPTPASTKVSPGSVLVTTVQDLVTTDKGFITSRVLVVAMMNFLGVNQLRTFVNFLELQCGHIVTAEQVKFLHARQYMRVAAQLASQRSGSSTNDEALIQQKCRQALVLFAECQAHAEMEARLSSPEAREADIPEDDDHTEVEVDDENQNDHEEQAGVDDDNAHGWVHVKPNTDLAFATDAFYIVPEFMAMGYYQGAIEYCLLLLPEFSRRAKDAEARLRVAKARVTSSRAPNTTGSAASLGANSLTRAPVTGDALSDFRRWSRATVRYNDVVQRLCQLMLNVYVAVYQAEKKARTAFNESKNGGTGAGSPALQRSLMTVLDAKLACASLLKDTRCVHNPIVVEVLATGLFAHGVFDMLLEWDAPEIRAWMLAAAKQIANSPRNDIIVASCPSAHQSDSVSTLEFRLPASVAVSEISKLGDKISRLPTKTIDTILLYFQTRQRNLEIVAVHRALATGTRPIHIDERLEKLRQANVAMRTAETAPLPEGVAARDVEELNTAIQVEMQTMELQRLAYEEIREAARRTELSGGSADSAIHEVDPRLIYTSLSLQQLFAEFVSPGSLSETILDFYRLFGADDELTIRHTWQMMLDGVSKQTANDTDVVEELTKLVKRVGSRAAAAYRASGSVAIPLFPVRYVLAQLELITGNRHCVDSRTVFRTILDMRLPGGTYQDILMTYADLCGEPAFAPLVKMQLLNAMYLVMEDWLAEMDVGGGASAVSSTSSGSRRRVSAFPTQEVKEILAGAIAQAKSITGDMIVPQEEINRVVARLQGVLHVVIKKDDQGLLPQ